MIKLAAANASEKPTAIGRNFRNETAGALKPIERSVSSIANPHSGQSSRVASVRRLYEHRAHDTSIPSRRSIERSEDGAGVPGGVDRLNRAKFLHSTTASANTRYGPIHAKRGGNR